MIVCSAWPLFFLVRRFLGSKVLVSEERIFCGYYFHQNSLVLLCFVLRKEKLNKQKERNMSTTSVKIKFRNSSVDGKVGTLYYQVIRNRQVRQINTDYRLHHAEWHDEDENIVISRGNDDKRKEYLQELSGRIRGDQLRFREIVNELENNENGYTADDVVAQYNALASRQSFQVYMESVIEQLKAQGRTRTSETYAAAKRSFITFLGGREFRWIV